MTRATSYHLTPRDRLVRHGATSLSDAELVSFFVRGRGGRTPVDIAETVLAEVGGLAPLIVAEPTPTGGPRPLGAGDEARLAAAVEMVRRLVETTLATRDVLSSPADVRRHLALRLCGLQHEVFAVLLLDNRHRVIEYRELFRGTIDSAAVYPREVVKHCLSRNAAAVILAHNHPSGAPRSV